MHTPSPFIIYVIIFITIVELNAAEVSYHTCKVAAWATDKDVEDFKEGRPSRSKYAECFRICYAKMTNNKYYNNKHEDGSTEYDRFYRVFRCPKPLRNVQVIPDGVIPPEYQPQVVDPPEYWLKKYGDVLKGKVFYKEP